MCRTSKLEDQIDASGLLFPVAIMPTLTSLISYSVEFALMFLAPALYVAHTIMTGLAIHSDARAQYKIGRLLLLRAVRLCSAVQPTNQLATVVPSGDWVLFALLFFVRALHQYL
jgi:phosphotransferase system  glucose/maltose/N-acetylglucosamine-specific IIC component